MYYYYDSNIILLQKKVLVQELESQHTDAVRSLIQVNKFVWSGSAELDAHICVWQHEL